MKSHGPFYKLQNFLDPVTPALTGIVTVIYISLLSLILMSLQLQCERNGQPFSCLNWTLDQQGWNSLGKTQLWMRCFRSTQHSILRYSFFSIFLGGHWYLILSSLERLNWHHLEALGLFDWCYDCVVCCFVLPTNQLDDAMSNDARPDHLKKQQRQATATHSCWHCECE